MTSLAQNPEKGAPAHFHLTFGCFKNIDIFVQRVLVFY